MSKFFALLFILLCFPFAVFADTPPAPPRETTAATAQAQTATPPAGVASVQAGIRSTASTGRLQDFCNGQSLGTCVGKIVGSLIRVLLSLVGLILVGYLIYAGFLWMTSGGESDKAEESMKMIRNAVVGLVILASAFAIASFVLGGLSEAVTPPVTTSAETETPAPR